MREGEFQQAFGRENHHTTLELDRITGREYVIGKLFEDVQDGVRQTRDYSDKARFTGSNKTYRDLELQEGDVYYTQDENGLTPQVHGITDGTHQTP